jgi:hypothetical protein
MSNAVVFQHKELDTTQASIRLVHLRRKLSPNGLLRCVITHTTTASDYVCLSYRWGDADPNSSCEIILNGKSFYIRQNLFHFLQHVHYTAHPSSIVFDPCKGFWIDALCINQQNTSERNHQVAQMGSIFSIAKGVILWLGKATSESDRIHCLLDPDGYEKRAKDWVEVEHHDRITIHRRILQNDYWNRAWVTQEVILAQKAVVLIDDWSFEFSELVNQLSCNDINWSGTGFEQFVRIRNGSLDLFQRTLLYVLSHFQDRLCSIPHDRVYSLLSVCYGGQTEIEVDYNTPISQVHKE